MVKIPTPERKLILNETLPQDLRDELEADAQMRDLTLNDAATRILAEKFGVEWHPSGRAYKPSSAEKFKLRVANELHRELRLRAANELQTIRGITLHILTTHYNTNIIEPTRRQRRDAA